MNDPYAVREKCFVGIEAEGPHRGQRVLFVPGCVTPEDFVVASMQMGSHVDRIYYGAGNSRDLNGFTLAAIYVSYPPEKITIEVGEVGPLWPCLHAKSTIVSWNSMDLMERANFFKKIEGETIYWIGGPGQEYATSVNDPLFNEDKEI